MKITKQMIEAARRAEFDFYRRHRILGQRFRPIPDAQLHAVLEAAIGAIGEEDDVDPAPAPEMEELAAVEATPALITPTRIVRALKPRPKR